MQCTRPNRPHQNKRKQPAIADCTHTVAEALSTHVSIVLTRVSVPAEDESHQSSFSLISIKDQYRSTHSYPQRTSTEVPTHVLLAKHKQSKISINNKRRHTQALIVLQRPQTTK
jgi:hypothetical protein